MAASMPQEFVHYPTIIRNAPFEGKDTMADYAEKKMQQQEEMMGIAQEKDQSKVDTEQGLKLVGELGKIFKVLQDEKIVNNKEETNKN